MDQETTAKYTISFAQNSEDATGSMASVLVEESKTISLPTNQFSLQGHSFSGWAESPNGAVLYADEANFTIGNMDVILYAKWDGNSYTVTLNQESGTGGTESVSATFGLPMPLYQISPTREGYTFNGYFSETDGSGTQYYDGDMVSAHDWDLTSDSNLYANWIANTYTVVLSQGNGSGGTESVTATFGSPMPLADPPSYTNFTFGGYFTESEGAGTQYYNGAMASVTDWNIASDDIVLYAKWTYSGGVGDIGPSGGLVFYDKGSYSDGWRYMEAAPVGWDGVNDYDPLLDWFGGSNIFSPSVVGTTSTAIGTGKANTEDIVSSFGTPITFPNTTYAAYVCLEYSITVEEQIVDDWFLPSIDELDQMFTNLGYVPAAGFENTGEFYYWSSSEDADDASLVWGEYFIDGGTKTTDSYTSTDEGFVRPVRSF